MIYPVAVENLTRYYGEHRGIIDVSFTVDEGVVFGFLGPNGAGKTTLIRHLMGILKPTSGRATIFGHDCWNDRVEVQQQVGFLPSDIQFRERMTAGSLLEFYGSFRPGSPYRRRIKMLADRFDLDLRRSVQELSSGNRQKVGLIQAFMHDTPLLILDEPTSGLDPLKQQEFHALITEEQQRGKTIFLSSHDLHEVERIASHVGLIRGGELITIQEINDLRSQRQRQMDITLAEPACLENLRRLDSVESLTVNDTRTGATLRVSRPILPVLQELAKLPVDDLIFGPPDLESVFIGFYDAEIPDAVLHVEEEPR
jgi:ABC-2 type transport system ATP-binding protein